jgi:hypothetical protein
MFDISLIALSIEAGQASLPTQAYPSWINIQSSYLK